MKALAKTHQCIFPSPFRNVQLPINDCNNDVFVELDHNCAETASVFDSQALLQKTTIKYIMKVIMHKETHS